MSKVDSDEEKELEKVTQEFQEFVIAWVKIDDKIREHNAILKELKTDKKEYEKFILEYMSKINENVINISDGKLRLNKSKTKSALKEENICSAINDCINDSEKAKQLTKYIFESRPSVERLNLKRTKNRKKKKKPSKDI